MSRSKSKEKNIPIKGVQTSRYEIVNLGIGLAAVFIAVLALLDGGIVGRFLTNVLLLLVGQIYWLIFILLAGWGLLLVVRGRIPRLRFRTYLGGALFFIALATILHVNAFPIRQPQEIIGSTYQTFTQNISTGQGQSGLGGGMLGAFSYWAFGSLFGKVGTYLFSGLILLVGTIMILPFSLDQIRSGVYLGFKTSKEKVGNLVPSWDEVKEVFYQEEDQRNDADVEEGEKSSFYVKSEKISKRKGFSTFFSTKESNAVELESEYQPAYRQTKRSNLESFDLEQNPTINRIARETKILDLDYFDQVNQHAQPSFRREVEIVDSTSRNLEGESQLNVLETSEIAPTAKEVEARAPKSQSKAEIEAEKPEGNNQVEKAQTAGHWQEQANVKQDLTGNQVDRMLEQGQMTDSIEVKPPSRKRAGSSLKLPGKNLLKKIPPVDQSEEYARINENIEKLERTFESFGVKAKVVRANLGPSVTKYEIEPAIGVKVAKIVSLADDIALALAARDVRIEAPIPGKSLIGIEVPNTQVSPVSFWEIIDAALESKNLLEVPLGRDISGSVCLADLTKMPHLLIAGATGSGKSVGMNVIIVSLLMKCQPDQVKFLMIDPKKVELTMYDDLPHLIAPVVTNPRKAAQALNKIVQEMERRYELFAGSNVRNIDSYNQMVDQWNKETRDKVYEKLPKIVVFVDELADLMMVASNDVESAIIRLAQMARAAGIHMIIATQRPSVDVITGIIKANVPSRLAFAVSSGTDSRTILDSVGAEKLLGRGDMLFQPMGKNKPVRVQGAYISDTEVERITDFIKDQAVADYADSLIQLEDDHDGGSSVSEDEYFQEAAQMLEGMETISISQLQRRFRIGYNRAARLIDDMEAAGLVSGQDGSKPRQVL